MKNFILTFLFLTTLLSAQNKRFSYEYTFIPDSTNNSDIIREIMNLDISDKGSKFYSYTVYQGDSLMKVDLEKQLKTTGTVNIRSDQRKGNVRYTVLKNYPDYQVFLKSKIFADTYKIQEDRKLDWKISEEKQKIGIWNAQKATVDFGGRSWTAWFASEIPFPDGPYKFYGLPGLIVRLEDKTQSHIFELKEIKNLGKKTIEENIFSLGNDIAVNRKQFQKLYKEYENDPTKGMKQTTIGGANIILTQKNGDNEKFMREREKQIKEKLKKDNNKIELE